MPRHYTNRMALVRLTAALGLFIAIAAAPAAIAAEATVTIDNFTFNPAVLTVAAGTSVTWLNRDDIPHLVVENGGAFRSAALDTDDTFTMVFANPGTVEYFCALHPHMTGTIVVTP